MHDNIYFEEFSSTYLSFNHYLILDCKVQCSSNVKMLKFAAQMINALHYITKIKNTLSY